MDVVQNHTNTAGEHAMMEKLMVDSLVTWARDYKVDGSSIYLYGEGWNIGAVLRGDDPQTLMCDTNGDGAVDINDIRAIAAKRKQPATGPDDPMDWDQDGVITVADARGCQSACTLPRCAVAP